MQNTKEVKEIERRFLLKRIPQLHWDDVLDITQYYIKDGDLTKRLRYSFSRLNPRHTSGFEFLHKIMHETGVFTEVHETISTDQFSNIVNSAFKKLSKIRNIHYFKNQKFEIDIINDVNLILLEVELDDINQPIVFPPEIESEIIMEVTGIKELSNFALAENIQPLI